MSSNVNMLNETGGKTADRNAMSQSRATDTLNNVTSRVSGLVQEGTAALRNQIETVRTQGIEGVRRDVTDYARNQPVKALLLAGGIGALAALILRRR